MQQEFEQFVGSLFDELDEAWADLEANQARLAETSQELAEKQADLAGLEENWTADRRQCNESLQRRVVELEKERLVLLHELDAVRSRSEEFKVRLAEHQRRVAAERSGWQSELRLLREVLDRHAGGPSRRLESEADSQDECLPTDEELDVVVERNVATTCESMRPAATTTGRPQPASKGTSADPVLGSVLSQIEMLQCEVTRPRNGNGPRYG